MQEIDSKDKALLIQSRKAYIHIKVYTYTTEGV